MTVSIDCRSLTKRRGPRVVLDGLDWRIEPGQVVGVLGPSGAGKTTLLRILAGLDPADQGQAVLTRIALNPNAVRTGAIRVGMVFQNLALWPHLSARRHLQCVSPHGTAAEQRVRIESILTECLLPRETWDRPPAALSGGEGQRLALARALAHEPELLLLDEPLAHLDASLRDELLELLRRVTSQRAMTVVFVTHRLDEAQALCPCVVQLREGKIVEPA